MLPMSTIRSLKYPLNFKMELFSFHDSKSSIGTVLAVIFDHELTAAEKSDVANAFEEFLNNNVNLGGTDYTITSQPAIILNNKASESAI